MRRYLGTPKYLAPEFIEDKEYDQTVDIWAIGVIAYTLLAGYFPFDAEEDPDLWKQIIKVNYEFHPDVWDEIPPEPKDFIRRTLVKEPSQRPTARELINHTWIQSSKPEDFISPKKNPRTGLVLRLGSYSTKVAKPSGRKYNVH